MKEVDPAVARQQRHQDLRDLKRLYVDIPNVPEDYGKHVPTMPAPPLTESWAQEEPPPPWPAPEVHRRRATDHQPIEVTEAKARPPWEMWAFCAGTFGLLLGITMPAMNWALPLIPSAAGVGLGIYALRHPNARKGFAIAGLVTGLLGLLCTWGLFRMYSDAMDALDNFEQEVENLDG